MATVGNVFALEDVTLNLGTVATVDTATYDEDLRRCQRYFQTTSIPVSASTDSYFGLWFYKVSMRATPTITGGGAGFTVNASSSEDVLICYQTTRAIVLLTASSRL